MKRALVLTLFSLLAAGFAAGQSAKDLYLSYESSSGSQGQPGMKIETELTRDGQTRTVSPQTRFREGDGVRFRFRMNFKGYVTVVLKGSSGRQSVLYSGLVNTASSCWIPSQGNFRFDETPGTETLLFHFSKRPADVSAHVASSGGSVSPAPSPDQEAEILQQLNSRSIKDLVLDTGQEASYAAGSALQSGPAKVTLKLIHE